MDGWLGASGLGCFIVLIMDLERGKLEYGS